MIGLKSSTLSWILLQSEVRNHQVPWTSKCPSKTSQMKSRDRWLRSHLLNSATWNLACMLFKHCSIFANLQIIYITHIYWFCRRLKRVGSVLSRSELDPFLYIWYHTFRTRNGLSPCVISYYWVIYTDQVRSSEKISPKCLWHETKSSWTFGNFRMGVSSDFLVVKLIALDLEGLKPKCNFLD